MIIVIVTITYNNNKNNDSDKNRTNNIKIGIQDKLNIFINHKIEKYSSYYYIYKIKTAFSGLIT